MIQFNARNILKILIMFIHGAIDDLYQKIRVHGCIKYGSYYIGTYIVHVWEELAIIDNLVYNGQ